MRAWNRRNLVPDDRARPLCTISPRAIQNEVFDTLRIEMNFTLLVAREALEQFREGALRAVAAVDERGNDREPQVRASTYGDCWGTD